MRVALPGSPRPARVVRHGFLRQPGHGEGPRGPATLGRVGTQAGQDGSVVSTVRRWVARVSATYSVRGPVVDSVTSSFGSTRTTASYSRPLASMPSTMF